jgi:HPt (histidine-containing phosphotransfer) domain-containing protein
MRSFLALVAGYLPESNLGSDAPSALRSSEFRAGDEPLISEFGTDPEMADVLVKFRERLRTQTIEDLRAAAAAMDLELLGRVAHQLKGAGGGYGFPAISAAAEQLERVVREDATSPELARRTRALIAICERAAQVDVP